MSPYLKILTQLFLTISYFYLAIYMKENALNVEIGVYWYDIFKTLKSPTATC